METASLRTAQKIRDEIKSVSPGMEVGHILVMGVEWIALYFRDLAARKEIKDLQNKIRDILAGPRGKEEIMELFQNALARHRENRVLHFIKVLTGIQNNQEALILPFSDNVIANPDLTKKELDRIAAALPAGTSDSEKEALILPLRKRIAELEAMIESELSPDDRWFYDIEGKRIKYPQGCKWTWYVRTWEEVSREHREPVSIRGQKLHEDGRKIYNQLGLKPKKADSPRAEMVQEKDQPA